MDTLETIIQKAYLRGASWIRENSSPEDAPYVQKAARDYADKTISTSAEKSLLAEARDLFREYEALHMDKPQNPNTDMKVQRNRIMADKLDRFLGEETSIINCDCGGRVGRIEGPSTVRCQTCERLL